MVSSCSSPAFVFSFSPASLSARNSSLLQTATCPPFRSHHKPSFTALPVLSIPTLRANLEKNTENETNVEADPRAFDLDEFLKDAPESLFQIDEVVHGIPPGLSKHFDVEALNKITQDFVQAKHLDQIDITQRDLVIPYSFDMQQGRPEPSDEFKSRQKVDVQLQRWERVQFNDAMEFFRLREGKWRSWRVTHHLAFRRSETGGSAISMQCLEKEDPKIIALCKEHKVDPEKAIGGCYVTWKATLAWDQEGDNHEGSTVFALVPSSESPRKGKILRDRGYAEVVQIAGDYYLDDEDALCLVTPYDGGEVRERFFFDGPDLVHRASSVRRFGGLSNTTFATEQRDSTVPPCHEYEPARDFARFGVIDTAAGNAAEAQALAQARATQLPRGPPSAFQRYVNRDGSSAAPSAAPMYGARARQAQSSQPQGPPSIRSLFNAGFGQPQSQQKDNQDSQIKPTDDNKQQ